MYYEYKVELPVG